MWLKDKLDEVLFCLDEDDFLSELEKVLPNSGIISAEQFYEAAIIIEKKFKDDRENFHVCMDVLTYETIKRLGYNTDIFERNDKWYS